MQVFFTCRYIVNFKFHRLIRVWIALDYMDATTLNRLRTWNSWSWRLAALEVEWNLAVVKVFNRFCSWALIIFGLSDVEVWFNPNAEELGIEIGCNGIHGLGGWRNWAEAALVGHELLFILSVVDCRYSSLKWWYESCRCSSSFASS